MVKTLQEQMSQLPAVVARLAGSIVPELQQRIYISSWLEVAVYEMPEATDLPEEAGRLISLPVDDEVFGLQLAYILNRTASNSSIVHLSFHPEFLAQWPGA